MPSGASVSICQVLKGGEIELTPGKKGASAIPSTKRTAIRPPKLLTPAVDADMHDHNATQHGR